jgi:hypothetical protein
MAKSKAKQALEFVREIAPKCETATDLHNAFWGNGGKLGQLFTTQDERKAFMKTPEYKEIGKIWESLPWYWDAPRAKKQSNRKRVQK